MSFILSRRACLRGLGAVVALPWLEAMVPTRARAATPSPSRYMAVYLPNGCHDSHFRPPGTLLDATVPPALQPLLPVADRVTVISGLRNVSLPPGGELCQHCVLGAGTLTGEDAFAIQPQSPHGGASVDQVIAAHLAGDTRFRSLELSSEGSFTCQGIEELCEYAFHIAYAGHHLPLPKMLDTRAVFERLFGTANLGETDAQRARRLDRDRHLLDFVLDDAKRLDRRLGVDDRARLDEYLTGINELERRIFADESGTCIESDLDPSRFLGGPQSIQSHVDDMLDLAVLALRCDLTRVVTYMFGVELSRTTYPFLGVPEEHHYASHHREDPTLLAAIEAILGWHMGRFASLVERLDAVDELDGTLLDHTLLVGLGGMGEPNAHVPDDVPVVLAGGAAGWSHGTHRTFQGTPLADLHVSTLQGLGLDEPRFGREGTGPLPGL